MRNMLIGVLGHQNSGKSETWKMLFGDNVRTGSNERRLYLTDDEYIIVFLVSGSAEERHKYVGDIIKVHKPRIILCSMQYIEDVTDTLGYFIERDYFLYLQWLNPGYYDNIDFPYHDYLGVLSYIQFKESTISIRNGKLPAYNRANEIRNYLYGWANFNNLLIKD